MSTPTPLLEELLLTLEAALRHSEDGDLCSSQDLMREAINLSQSALAEARNTKARLNKLSREIAERISLNAELMGDLV